ncbi:hypothetical protein CHS0354_029929 [Potamilus streckersoni]|uniref:CFA20 domain-containing protein n=1 Tax=Potamilus streckersoni TaxID=2493646 RepID=A0AAE0RT32_9BIVA|nr:hypothetical protein CHS0354_029929 [Potamilus streckersoni]
MFKNEYQGGVSFEVFSPQGKDPAVLWKVTGNVKKVYDRDVKSYVYALEGSPATNKMQLPKDSRQSLTLIQRYLIIQIYIPKGSDFSMELGVTDMGNNKRRLCFSSAQKDTQITPLHARIPLTVLKRGMWLNLCLDMVSMVGETWNGQTYKAIEGVNLSANCKVRKIFTMKVQPPDTAGDEELYGCAPSNIGELEPVPQKFQFATDVQHITQLLTVDKIKHAERLRSGCGPDSSHPLPNLDLDLNASGRRSSVNDAYHIAFGSKVPGIPISQNTHRKSARDDHLSSRTNRSIYSGAGERVNTTANSDISASISSQDTLYSGRDPGGGVHMLNPSIRPVSIVNHRRQSSDPVLVQEINFNSNMVQPHPPREPSSDRVRRKIRVKGPGSAGNDRVSSAGSQKDESGIGTSAASSSVNMKVGSQQASPIQNSTRSRVMSDTELMSTSGSSNEGGTRNKSADQAKRQADHTERVADQFKIQPSTMESSSQIAFRGAKPKQEYRSENYQDSEDIDDSVLEIIDILKNKTQEEKIMGESSEEGESTMPTGEYEESDEDEDKGRDTYLFASPPKLIHRKLSPSQFLESEYSQAQQDQRLKNKKGSKDLLTSRGPRPEDDFVQDEEDSSDEDRDIQKRGLKTGSRPESGTHSGSGTHPGSSTRPGSGTKPGTSSRPDSGNTRPNSGSTKIPNELPKTSPKAAKDLTVSSSSRISPRTAKDSSGGFSHSKSQRRDKSGSAINVASMLPVYSDNPSEKNDHNHSPTQNGSINSVSRMSRRSLREIPSSDARLFQKSVEKQYDHTKYLMENLTDSYEARMLKSIQGMRCEDETTDIIASPRKPGTSIARSPRPVQQGDGVVRHIFDDSPTLTSDDDTSFSTWKAPAPKPHNYQEEMKSRMSSDTLTSSNPRDWSGGVFSPPIVLPHEQRDQTLSNSLDDISMSSLSPRKPLTDADKTEEDELDLLYDPCLNCYYDPVTCKYYELA